MTPLVPARRPSSTYRVQLHRGFAFRDVCDLVPYLAALGVSDCYSSPHFRANPGSLHGYDICDHSQLNPELGTEADYVEFCNALKAAGLGHIVDIVPNHMAADSRSNPWWRDVLENGPSSPFADFFDIDWQPVKDELIGKVLLPVLGDQYGRALDRGELQLALQDGALHLHYFDRDLPINPRQTPRILKLGIDRLEEELTGDPALREYLSVLTSLENLPPYTERDPGRIAERQREKEVARERLARVVEQSPSVARHVEQAVVEANGVPGRPETFDVLHEFLERQAYRLAYWRTAFDEINYRRFFDVNSLVGLRVEHQAVFDAAHVLLKRLADAGHITGVRVDHPDGLADPVEYFERLHALLGAPMYVVAEKILSDRERLGDDWKVAGTTGYGFLNTVGGLFVDPRHVRKLRRIYTRLTGRTEPFEEVAYRSRVTIMVTSMASELNVLAHALNRISEADRRWRDFTLSSCRRVLREVVACFPVYRTYISPRGASAFDRDVVETAVAEARRRNPVMEDSIFDFFREVMLPSFGPEGPADEPAQERLAFAMNVQQFTAPVFAKGVEDTAFYRYHVLASANDVGGHPNRPATEPEEFHEANRRTLAEWPLEMHTTATHDTKRGEDARVRIAALSEVPDEWRRLVASWMRINGRNRTKLQGSWAPDRNDEYLFYQGLLGTWPAQTDASSTVAQAPQDVADRVEAYMQKTVREAKVNTSWIHEAPEYGRAVSIFVGRTLSGRTAPRFLASFVPFARRVARAGMVNSLSQLVLKIASPGVPDFYQGSEFWDLNLVDPDNRRPVDFALRRTALSELMPLLRRLEAGDGAIDEVRALLESWESGRIKLLTTARGLRFRHEHQALLLDGAYEALAAEGAASQHVVSFARRSGSEILIAIVPRLVVGLPPEGWNSTSLLVPGDALGALEFTHLLTGEAIRLDAGRLPLTKVFETLPVALLYARAA
ncbi:MAG: malto-oligosyltrehalose synthase [Vicinamibacterales bacterium]